MDWLTLAEELSVGHSRRTDCECGTGKSAIVSNTDMDYHIHCFRCGLHQNSRKKNLKLKIIGDEITCVELTLPQDYSTALTQRAQLYLWEKGIYPTLAKKYKIGWSEKLQRLIVPMYKKEELLAVMARDVTGLMKIKVLNSVNRKDTLFYSKSAECSPRRIVLVEDAFSCMKVGEVTACWALNGTALTKEVTKKLTRMSEVVVWMDPDGPGRRAAVKIKKALGSLTRVRIILSDRDPKYYTIKEIEEILK